MNYNANKHVLKIWVRVFQSLSNHLESAISARSSLASTESFLTFQNRTNGKVFGTIGPFNATELQLLLTNNDNENNNGNNNNKIHLILPAQGHAVES